MKFYFSYSHCDGINIVQYLEYVFFHTVMSSDVAQLPLWIIHAPSCVTAGIIVYEWNK